MTAQAKHGLIYKEVLIITLLVLIVMFKPMTPSFKGTAGDTDAYFSYDGGDYHIRTEANSDFLNSLHKTTGGQDFWFAFVCNIPAASSDNRVLFSTAAFGSAPGIFIRKNGGKLSLVQVGDSANLIDESVEDIPTDAPIILVVSHSHSENKTRFWVNTTTADEQAATFQTSVNDAFGTANIGRDVAGFAQLATGTRIYALSYGNSFLSDSDVSGLVDFYNNRHDRIYADLPPANGSATTASRGSTFFDGVDDKYTGVDSDDYDFPDADWFAVSLIYYKKTGGSPHIISIGNTGGLNTVQLYLNSTGVPQSYVRGSSGGAINAPTATGITEGWNVVGVQRNAGSIETFFCPLNGSSTFATGVAYSGGAIQIPSSSSIAFGARSIISDSRWFQGHISYVATGTGVLSAADVEALAAGDDINDDLSKSLNLYFRFDEASSTITDTINSNVITRVSTPLSRGAPKWTGLPFEIDTLDGRLDDCYGYVFQRGYNATTRTITFSGTYNGAPAGIEGAGY